MPTLEELGVASFRSAPSGKAFSPDASRRRNECDANDCRAARCRASRLEAREANQVFVELLGCRRRTERMRSPAQIALAWLLAQKPWVVPIPGTTKLARLDENVGAVYLSFTPGDLRDIDAAASKLTVHGARYPDALERMTGL